MWEKFYLHVMARAGRCEDHRQLSRVFVIQPSPDVLSNSSEFWANVRVEWSAKQVCQFGVFGFAQMAINFVLSPLIYGRVVIKPPNNGQLAGGWDQPVSIKYVNQVVTYITVCRNRYMSYKVTLYLLDADATSVRQSVS